MMPGSSTITTPMLAPAASAPRNRPGMPNNTRAPSAAARTSKPDSTVRSAPKRLAKLGASGAKTPKHSTGSVVSSPAPAPDSPVLARIAARTGATLDSAGRRFAPTRNNAATIYQRVLTELDNDD